MAKWFWSGLLILGNYLAPRSTEAQTRATSADLTGVVLDQSKAVLPGVTVTVTNADTGLTRTTVTEADGRFPFLPCRPASTRSRRSWPGSRRICARVSCCSSARRSTSSSRWGSPERKKNHGVGRRAARRHAEDGGLDRRVAAADREPADQRPQLHLVLAHHAGRHDRSDAAAGRVGDVGADVCRPARAVEQHHRRRPRQQRRHGRQRARDVQPGGRPRVPGADQLLLGRVRQGVRRRRQHRHQERHEHGLRATRSSTAATRR